MRVGIIALLQESNTFIRGQTTVIQFEQDLLAIGEEVRERMAAAHHEVGGFFAALAETDIEAVPIFAARALPFGVITGEAIEHLFSVMFRELERAGPLDGILVAPHGATVSQPYPDVDGHWLTRLRQTVGPKMPIISTLDPHGNLSPAMVDAVDAMIAYRTNPHLEQRERGLEAGRLMARTLRGEIRPTHAAVFPPMAINIESQLTSAPPCKPLYDLADSQLSRPGVLSNSIILGFPFADVAEMGSAAIVVTDNDPALARKLVGELGDYLWDHRQEFAGNFLSIEAALDQAATLPGPVCLLDMGDNIGGGSPADSTLLAEAIHRRRPGPAFVVIYDPESVQQAEAAGIGARVCLRVGGKSDDLHGVPLEAEFTVRSLHDGKFEESQPRHGGFTKFDQGRTAVVETDAGLTIMLTTRRMFPVSLRQLTTFGIEPKNYHLIVAKGVHAPVAAYAPVCPSLLRVDTPGATSADMRRLSYHRRRRPMFPFESDTPWKR